jgi:hypothetical protein
LHAELAKQVANVQRTKNVFGEFCIALFFVRSIPRYKRTIGKSLHIQIAGIFVFKIILSLSAIQSFTGCALWTTTDLKDCGGASKAGSHQARTIRILKRLWLG